MSVGGGGHKAKGQSRASSQILFYPKIQEKIMVALTRTQRRLLSGQKPLVGSARVRLTGAPRARLSWDVPAS